MPNTICPKCGFQQDEVNECLRCGIIFARYHTAATPAPQPAPQTESWELPARPAAGWFRRFYRVFRWVSLAALILLLTLILRPSPAPKIETTRGATERAEVKVEEFQASIQQGRPDSLAMDESELNGWLGENLALKRPAGTSASPPGKPNETAISLAKKALVVGSGGNPTVGQVQSTVRDVKIELRENSLRAYVVFDFHGMDLSLELEGQLLVRDGCLRLEPTAGKLGSLPLLPGTLESTASRLFDAPENREKFRLPAEIRDIRIQGGQFIISSW